MDENVYFGLNGIRKKPSNLIIASVIEDVVNNNYVHFDDLSYRYGLKTDEINALIEKVFPKHPKKPVVIVRQSAV